MHSRIKSLICFEGRATSCLFHLPLQAFMKLKARAGIIFRDCEKPKDGNPRKGDKKCH